MLGWLAVVALADSPDTPHLWVREFTAVALRPSGVVADVAAEGRIPVLRFGGVAFNDTFVGAGARVAASPAHLDTALRVSAQPIDLLPITIEAVRTQYWESPWGLVPLDQAEDTTSQFRRPLYEADADFAGAAWQLIVSPTLQAKAGPIVGFANLTITWLQVRPIGGTDPWVYEPYRGLVVAYDDRVLEYASAILAEPSDGEDRPLVRVGPVLRGKSSDATPDHTLTLGLLGQWRPGKGEYAPTMTALASPYLVDPDYTGFLPYFAFVVTFTAVVD